MARLGTILLLNLKHCSRFQLIRTLTGHNVGTDGTQTVGNDADGKATFSLKNGQQLTIKGIPKGCAYTVEEEDLTASGYTTTVDGSEGLTASGTLNENAAHSFVNNKQTVIPTGVSMEPRSLLLMALGFTVLVLTSLSLRRMGRRGKRKA